MSKTWVYKLNNNETADLRSKLNEDDFQFMKLNHAQFQVRGDGLTASMYNSGKLVVQGKNSEAWCVQYLGAKPMVASDDTSGKLIERAHTTEGANFSHKTSRVGDNLWPDLKPYLRRLLEPTPRIDPFKSSSRTTRAVRAAIQGARPANLTAGLNHNLEIDAIAPSLGAIPPEIDPTALGGHLGRRPGGTTESWFGDRIHRSGTEARHAIQMPRRQDRQAAHGHQQKKACEPTDHHHHPR